MKKTGFLLIFSLVIIGCKSKTEYKQISQQNEDDLLSKVNILTLLDYNDLRNVKAKLRTPEYVYFYENIIKKANKALQDGSFSVMQKTQTPPSGNKHDYISYGPYWWPNPNKADGLPWIRKDGQINPLTRDNTTDYLTKSHFIKNTSNLAIGYFFSDENKYADKAIELLSTWFLNEDTKMNPNLDFAQGIPGINTGRGIGIIDFAAITNVITAIELLEIKGAITKDISSALRQWFSTYLHWLQTSDNGVFERDTKNNHGTWYDNQIVSILIYLNRDAEAKHVLELAKTKRIANQIEPNGSQPLELKRTKSLHYSTMNLKGMTQLAYLGRKVGVDLWNYSPDGRGSIKKAYTYLEPIAKGEKAWTYLQIHSMEEAVEELQQLFLKTGCQFNIPEYRIIGAKNNRKDILLYYDCL